MSKINILHCADMQLEIRTGGRMSQRHDECKYVLDKFVEYAAQSKPDLIVITGDVFQYCDVNGDESKMFAQWIHALMPLTKGIRITNGNHDVRQKSNAIVENGKVRNMADPIDAVIASINSSKVVYWKHTGFYDDPMFDITWSVWSQLDKHSAEATPRPFNPWELPIEFHPHQAVQPKCSIELFHDPVRFCLGFDGMPMKMSENEPITYDSFKFNTVLAGDIHAPAIFQKEDFTFTYCSSLIQRNYGEGNYYSDYKTTVLGNNMHGFNDIVFDLTTDKVESIKFVSIPPSVGRHTIRLSKDFNYDLIPSLQIQARPFNFIRIVILGNLKDYINNEDKLISHFKSLYNCSVEIDFDKDAITEGDVQAFESIDSLVNMQSIKELAEKYINNIVDKTSTVDAENKEAAKKLFYRLLIEELEHTELFAETRHLELVSATINNFMTFGSDIQINFDNSAITRISGSNGVGKTTLYYFVAWMYTNKITSQQNDRDKKINYALVFNDRSTSDIVEGKLIFRLNGSTHVLTKTLQRNWKKGGEAFRFSKNWIDYLSGVPVLTMKLESSELTSDDTSTILEYLQDKVLTHNEYQRLMFANQAIIDNLIHSNFEELNQQILRNIGLDFNEKLDAKYEETKDKYLSKIAKPSATVEAMSISIATQEDVIKTSDVDRIIYVKQQQESEALEIEQRKIKDNLLLNMHNVRSKNVIDINLSNNETEINNAKVDIAAKEKQLQTIKDDKAKFDYSKVSSDLTEAQVKLNDVENQQKAHNNKVEAQTKQIEATNDNIKTTAQLVKSENETEVQQAMNAIQQNKADIEANKQQRRLLLVEATSKIEAAKAKRLQLRSEIVSKLSAKKLEYAELTSKKSQLESMTSIYNKDVESLTVRYAEISASTICVACGREHDHTTLDSIKSQLLVIGQDIENTKDKIKNNNLAIVDLMNAMSFVEKDSDSIQLEINDINVKLAKLDELLLIDDIGKLPQTFADIIAKNDELIKNDLLLAAASVDLDTALTKKRSELIDKIKSDNRIIELKAKLEILTTELEQLKLSVPDFNSVMTVIKLSITELSTKLASYADFDKQIANILMELTELNNKVITLSSVNENLLKEQLKSIENESIKKDIDDIDKLLAETTANKSRLESSINKIDLLKHTAASDIERLKVDIENAKKYALVESVLKLYKKMLGKTGLSQYIFEHVLPILNTKLNELLEEVQFRLYFDENDLQLKMIDLSKNVTRPVIFTSGMESTILGLSLVSVLRQLNTGKKTAELFLDELSGKLNDGKMLKYNAPDYKGIFARLINKIKSNANIYIIDHVIEDLNEDRTIEIQKTSSGSIVNTIY